MRLSQTTGLAIAAKEFSQWLAPFWSQYYPQRASAESFSLKGRGNKCVNAGWNVTLDQNLGHDWDRDQLQEPRNIGIAVSGGVDSMALVTLLARQYPQCNNRSGTKLHALIVDHKLRDNSTEEAALVARQVQKLNVTPHVLTLVWPTTKASDAPHNAATVHKPNKTHLETQARLERYKAIAQHCHALKIKDLFVGHHSGDQIETVLFRFSRASGIDGLAGIQELAPLGVLNVVEALDLRVIRPLLKVSKERLRATCEDAGTAWVEDPSNRSLDYQRNVIRHYQHDMDALVKQDPHSQLKPLSTTAMLAFQERMDQHRRAAWDQVRPWLQDIWFDSANGICHVKLQVTQSTLGSPAAQVNTAWLKDCESPVATRLLSFLVRWVSCRDHAPRLEEIQSLLRRLRQPKCITDRLSEQEIRASLEQYTTSNSTVYRRKKSRVSKHSLNRQELQQEAPQSNMASSQTQWQPINIAGVLFSPPRKNKGILDHWTISRQPMSHAEQIAALSAIAMSTVEDVRATQAEKESDILWDQRFFLRMSNLGGLESTSGRMHVRALGIKDVPMIRSLLSAQNPREEFGNDEEGLRKLDWWMATSPEKARFTVPIVSCEDVRQEGMQVCAFSLPTLGIHTHPSCFTVKSWFKSQLPRDSRDLSFGSAYEHSKL